MKLKVEDIWEQFKVNFITIRKVLERVTIKSLMHMINQSINQLIDRPAKSA